MPNFPHTPEALLGRNDSKNPSSTCKGITSSGRPCRRALASPNGKRKSNVSALNGVVALVEEDGRVQEADFYCWQHKDQAEEKIQQEVNKNRKARRKRSAELVPLQEMSSIDTLVQRLGIESVPEEQQNKRNSRPERQPKPPRRTETTDFADPAKRPSRTSYPVSPTEKHDATSARPSRKPAKKKPGFWASLCCVASDKDDDYVEIVRHRRRTEQAHRPSQVSASAPPPPRVSQASRPTSTPIPARTPLSPQTPTRPHQQRSSSNPQTNHLLSLIPQTCSPQTTSTLLAELIKPISPADEEGYIYIFWLTPQSKDPPPESTARCLLSPPERRPETSRRISDVMTEFSYDGDDDDDFGETSRGGRAKKVKTIMLKIGRANNITRRMNEWQRQCGYKLNLVRWYPYIPSNTPQPSPERKANQPLYPDLTQPPPPSSSPRRQSDVVRRVPYVKRVERLIHLEMAEKRVLRDCRACGKEHREWFEVEASQEGVKGVDECVRRWVEWAERQALGE
ncbi:hypothetical protein M409DRAFT_29714 [Zasmidium cellare ATCC 36951]|uniref:Bacteriophage T5 Orf172 DNA-binding domain-containing protein n=1 Tax=Zasmidium cellare ATCC 36951 TaxID=1080233 RepID=A0A6A6BYM7_ZASCE|nr:uncharacterized protein M409DRAFT_29714 [Zasmidium cellare ATCC 36951]KAF2159904.1 hypothetical protein M409DRAFT_29714 [Zasmidium cellare ATCC 36951]